MTVLLHKRRCLRLGRPVARVSITAATWVAIAASTTAPAILLKVYDVLALRLVLAGELQGLAMLHLLLLLVLHLHLHVVLVGLLAGDYHRVGRGDGRHRLIVRAVVVP